MAMYELKQLKGILLAFQFWKKTSKIVRCTCNSHESGGFQKKKLLDKNENL